MANLKDIRNRIKSVKSIQKVTKAMKMVAAAKMRRAQERMEEARPYAHKLQDVIQDLLPDVDRTALDLLDIRKPKRIGLVVVSSDRGMAGSFNSSVIKTAQIEIDKLGRDAVDVFCIGKKARDYFRRRNYTIIESFTDFWNELNFGHAIKIGDQIIAHFTQLHVDEIRVVFNEFYNVSTQKVKIENLLPLVFESNTNQGIDRLYEPNKDQIIKNLIPRHLNIQMWKYLLESFASEQAARMLAMENATENAGDMIKELTLEFNKARQAAITTEMLEIVGGAEALKN